MVKTLVDKRTIRVRFNEADPLGVVWHGHYVRYFEDGRESFGQKYGLSYLDFFNHGVVVPVVHIECDYKRPLRYGESVVVETEYIPCVAAKLQFKYRLLSMKGELVASGNSTQVFLGKEDFVLQLVNPAFFAEWKKEQGFV
ncbi:MAG: acyl-CoA thioesterase [Chitinophagaceae bacterium]|nr:MAG: acyl-CoA thioesterase [Chitinophagaceae bacterium]